MQGIDFRLYARCEIPGEAAVLSFFNREVEEDYDKRKVFLLEHNIAVWDVLKSCDREGLVFHRLPSTSPANTMPFSDKLQHWKVILNYI